MNEPVPSTAPEPGAVALSRKSGPLDGFSGRALSSQEEELVRLLRVAVDWEAPAWAAGEPDVPGVLEPVAAPVSEPPAIPAGRDPLAEWKSLLARPAVVQRRQSRGWRDPLVPAADTPVSATPIAGDGSGEPAEPVRVALVPRLAVVGVDRDGSGRPDPASPSWDSRWIVDGCRRLACAGARPWVCLWTPPDAETSVARRVAVEAVCRALQLRNAGSSAVPLSADGYVLVGFVEPPGVPTPSQFQAAGDVVLLLGEPVAADPLQGLGGSLYLDFAGPSAPLDLEAASVLNSTLLGLNQEGVIRSALDCGPGGLAVCLAACCAGGSQDAESTPALGAQVEFPVPPAESGPAPSLETLLFGEIPNRAVITVAPADAGRVIKQCRILGVPAMRLGVVGGDGIQVTMGETGYRLPVSELPSLMSGTSRGSGVDQERNRPQ